MGKSRISVIISTLLLCFSLGYLVFIVIQNKELYIQRFDHKSYEKKYYQSQWAVPNSKYPISDEDLFTFAGYRYLNGGNPILINPETAYLGKYIIGLSILLFNNQRIASIILAFLSLILVFIIIKIVTRSLLLSSLAVFLSVVNTIFTDQVIHAPQLDIFQLFFWLVSILFILLYQKIQKPVFLVLIGLSFGAFISAKTFYIYFSLFNFFLVIFYFLRRDKLIKSAIELMVINFFGLLVYLMTYTQYFIHGGTFRGFLGVQKWIFTFYSSSQIQIQKLLGNYLSLILFNLWRFWTDGYPIIHYQSWSFLWPIIYIVGTFIVISTLRKKDLKKQPFIAILSSWFLAYNAFLFVVPVFPRYLLLLFIPLNLSIVFYFYRVSHSKT